MKRFMKILSLGAAVLMLAGSLAACSGKPGAGLDLISEGKLVMGTNAFSLPLSTKRAARLSAWTWISSKPSRRSWISPSRSRAISNLIPCPRA